MTAARSGGDVWEEVRDRARMLMEAGQPLHTPIRGLCNDIIEVTDTVIHRRSEAPRSRGEGGPPRNPWDNSEGLEDAVRSGDRTAPAALRARLA
jgi:hypothetical protein